MRLPVIASRTDGKPPAGALHYELTGEQVFNVLAAYVASTLGINGKPFKMMVKIVPVGPAPVTEEYHAHFVMWQEPEGLVQ